MFVEQTQYGLIVDVDSETETDRLGQAIADVIEPGVIIGLIGPLGAGKTRLSRAIAEALGVDSGAIASPTFVLVHEYEGRIPVYHIDTYRLEDPDAFDALGIAEDLEGTGVCLIEWADRVMDRLPASTWWLQLKATGIESRRIEMRVPGQVAGRIADRIRSPE